MRGLVSAMNAPARLVGARRLPWATPPGASREGTRGRLPRLMVLLAYGQPAVAANAGSGRACVHVCDVAPTGRIAKLMATELAHDRMGNG